MSGIKLFLHTLIILFLFTSCAFDKPIEFKKIRKVKLTSIKDGMVELQGEAEFYNPNSMAGKIRKIEIDILMGDKILGHISLKEKLKVEKNAPFYIPLKAKLRMEDIQQGFLDNLLVIVGAKKLELHFKGKIKVSRWGISETVPVDYYQEVRL
ncbi:MAG: hypothetical protein ABFS32_03240 [Bacteroidota bacterium]